jgi:simple sugar transport system ATP-binding protein
VNAPRLELRHVSKRFGPVVANDGVSLRVEPGEIHAVLGENGAGKSTLMKIVYGALQPDQGEVLWDGRAVRLRSPSEARALGVAMVFQHFSLFETLTVAENVWLGLQRSEPLEQVKQEIREKAAEYELELDPDRPVHVLSVGERQRVEIVRALLTNPRLLILDEPTSVLTPKAVEKLFVTLRKLAGTGCSILYISHKLDEILALCSRCTVLRGGKVTGACEIAGASASSLSTLMIGREPAKLSGRVCGAGATVLRVRDLSLQRHGRFGVPLDRISLEVRSGEVVGIAGISGNGQQELLAALSGEDPRGQGDSIELLGAPIGGLGADARRKRGLNFVPEERLGRGAVPSMSLASNLLLTRKESLRSFGWIDRLALRTQTEGIIDRFHVTTSGPAAMARSLSGGNLQKYIMGREIDAVPKVLIVSQPTWGVDVGAAAQIRGELLALAEAGCGVLVVSEEIEELCQVTQRIYVIAKGRLSPPLQTEGVSIPLIGEWMSGLWPKAAAPAPAPAPGAAP